MSIEKETTTYYRIERHYSNKIKKKRTMRTGLSLESALTYCEREDSKGDGWYDSFAKEY